MRDDLRLAFRRLIRQPGFSLVAILTLALGLGANTSIFTLLSAIMFRPLPVIRPAELYRLGADTNCCVNTGLQSRYSLFSAQLFQQLHDSLPEFTELAAMQSSPTVTGLRPASSPIAQSAPASFVSGNYFRMFGVTPAAGRLLESSDDAPGATPVMVLSYGAWTSLFSRDTNLIGSAMFVGGVPVTLVGVAAPDFFGETVRPNPAGFWMPLGQERAIRGTAAVSGRPQTDWLYAIGRLKPDARPEAVQAKATAALQSWLGAQTFLSDEDRKDLPKSIVPVVPVPGGVPLMVGGFGQSLTLLMWMSGLVLLIAAANLANLLLARADRATASIRAAMGASVSRLVRQSLIEGMLLSLAGCAGALLMSVLATRAIVSLAFPPDVVLPVSLVPSPMVLAFAVGLALITGVAFSAVPAWATGKTDPIQALRGMAREGADVSFMPRRSLVVVQITLSLILLAGAGLLAKSLSKLETQPLGFDADQRMVVRIDPPAIAGEPERLAQMYTRMKERIDQIPGVVHSSYSLYSPMEGNNWSSGISINGRPSDLKAPDSSSWNRVGPSYFETMGTRLLRGRGINDTDTMTSAHVAVVGAAFAKKFFGSADPIGHTLGIGGPSHNSDYTIVGVAEDVKYTNVTAPVRPMIFLPVMQFATYGPGDEGNAQVQTRSSLARTLELQLRPGVTGIEPAVRRALSEAHQDLVATRFVPMHDQVSGNFRTNRLLATLASSYGFLALALASLGLYGVTAYGVARRQHEIGVRMALGADRRRIVTDILKGAILQTMVGLAIGVPLAMLATKALTSQLFNVNARDPWVFGTIALALLVTSALAAALPARRAASIDPTRALRQ